MKKTENELSLAKKQGRTRCVQVKENNKKNQKLLVDKATIYLENAERIPEAIEAEPDITSALRNILGKVNKFERKK